MKYRKYPSGNAWRNLVECFFTWEGDAGEQLDVQSPPSGYAAIVFNWSVPYQAYQHGSDRRLEVPLAFVSGQFTSNYHLVLSGQIGMVGIVLRPTAIHHLFGVRMSHLVNNRVDLNMLIGDGSGRWLGEVARCRTDVDRLQTLERFLAALTARAPWRSTIIDQAVAHIDAQMGMVSVEGVAGHVGLSRRHLEKQFLEKVGISPKFYARIRRFSHLSNKVAWSRRIDWQQLVFEYGFHDQSHLIREFLEFNRMNPTDYFRSHQELTRLLNRA